MEDNKTMKTTDLKLFAGFYIMEHDELPNEDKLRLLEYVQESDRDQVLSLLSTGMMDVGEPVSEVVDIITQVTELCEGLPPVEHGALIGAGAIVVAAAILSASSKLYKRHLSKAARSCRDYGSVKKTACMNKFKIDAIKGQIGFLKKSKSRVCAKSKKPAKCNAKVDRKIAKLKAKLGEVGV